MAIRWNDQDYNNLKRAVSNFNRKIRRLDKNPDISPFLPSIRSYVDLKAGIQTRQELERTISNLERFSKRNAQDLVTIGDNITTRWEAHTIKISSNRILNELQEEKLNLQTKSLPRKIINFRFI